MKSKMFLILFFIKLNGSGIRGSLLEMSERIQERKEDPLQYVLIQSRKSECHIPSGVTFPYTVSQVMGVDGEFPLG